MFVGASLEGINTYKGDFYEVWQVSDEVFKKMCKMTDEEFNSVCQNGWWRNSDGSALGTPTVKFTINGKEITAWDGEERKNFREDVCSEYCDDFGKECDSKEEDRLCCCGEREYNSLTEYLSEEMGVSAERNVCACAVDLAKYNHMSMGELFRKFEPIK